MLSDVTTVTPTMSSYMNLISHTAVRFMRFCFFEEVELIGFHDNLLADFNGLAVNRNRLSGTLALVEVDSLARGHPPIRIARYCLSRHHN